ARALRQQIHQLALEPVRVLELVDHDRAEAELLSLADLRMARKQVAGGQLEVLEVERRLPLLRGRVRAVEAAEELLEQLAVARGDRVERGLLDPLSRLLVRCRALAAAAEGGQIEQPVGKRSA